MIVEVNEHRATPQFAHRGNLIQYFLNIGYHFLERDYRQKDFWCQWQTWAGLFILGASAKNWKRSGSPESE